MYKDTRGKRTSISVAGFSVDLKEKKLLIDQLQGGTTIPWLNSKEARRARMKFKISPEEILFEQVKAFATTVGIRTLGLRKPEHSRWHTVSASKKPTLYATVVASQGLSAGKPEDEYYTTTLD